MTVVEMARVDASMSTFLMVGCLQPAQILCDVLRGCVARETGSSCTGCVLLLLNAPREYLHLLLPGAQQPVHAHHWAAGVRGAEG